MAARKKPLQTVPPADFSIETSDLSSRDAAAIEKDRPLIQAAFATDHVIITQDHTLQRALEKTPQGRSILRQIRWIDPVSDGTAVLSQL